MKLIIFPLIFLIIFAFMSMMGVGTADWNPTGEFGGFQQAAGGWYDANAHLVAYANGSYAGEYGNLTFPITAGSAGPWNSLPLWKNTTSQYNVYDEFGERITSAGGIATDFSVAGAIGLMGIVIGGVVLAGVVGTRIFGSGVSEEAVSAIWKTTVLIAVWGVFSVLSLNFIAGASFLGPFFWLFLTFIYTMGIINQVGHPGED